jgi:carboxy-terminal domain RNA polymerase II polypeptide A small phosphatase
MERTDFTVKLLILDLDETLYHGVEEPWDREPDFRAATYFFYKRPGVDRFLARMNSMFELAVWTSSTPLLAKAVVPLLFSEEIKLSFVWARDRCTYRYNPDKGIHYWAKNLDKLKKRGYKLEEVIMVDDTPDKLSQHYSNLVSVTSFEGDPLDRELDLLGFYLETLALVPNVRAVEKRTWRSIAKKHISSP